MEAVIDEALGKVAGLHALGGLAVITKDHFVHAGALIGQLKVRFQLVADVVRVHQRIDGGVAEAGSTVGQDVSECTNEHAEVAVESADAADGLGAVVIEMPGGMIGRANVLEDRNREERFQVLLDGNGTAAGAAAAVGRAEGLVQIQVHDIDTEIAGAAEANQRVHVRAIHVKHGAFGMQQGGNFGDIRFKDAERAGVGDHERGDIVRTVVFQNLYELFDIHHALFVGLDVLDGVAGHAGCGGVGAVGGIRN